MEEIAGSILRVAVYSVNAIRTKVPNKWSEWFFSVGLPAGEETGQ